MSYFCPFCETGTLTSVQYTEHVKAGRRVVEVPGLTKMICAECESESIPSEVYEANSEIVRSALVAQRGAITRGALRRFREIWGVTQRQASVLVGAGVSSFAKWESGQAHLSTPAALLVQCALRYPSVVEYLADLAEVKLEPIHVIDTTVPSEMGWHSWYSPDTRFGAEQSSLRLMTVEGRFASPKPRPPRASIEWANDCYDSFAVTAANGTYMPSRVQEAA
jgi:putative zinc finger/helix-turn-helix YgiT family protein